MAYAAYLRIYEPVSAFHEPDRSRWVAYANSATRPRRRDSLAVEHAEALRRAITTPQVTVPERESEHAYVRRADGITYVCPWQTRLRCLLAYGQMRSESDDDPALATMTRLGKAGPARLHILASIWTVPLTWFVPFAPAERWLSLGEGRGRAAGPATASAIRALVYTTPMARARRRVARGLAALRHLPAGSGDIRRSSSRSSSRPGPSATWPKSAAGWRISTRTRSWSSTMAGSCTWSATTRCAEISRWPRSAPPSTARP